MPSEAERGSDESVSHDRTRRSPKPRRGAVGRGVGREASSSARSPRIAALDGEVNAFLHVSRDDALAQARAVDAKRARGEALGKLSGVAIAIKDALCTRGLKSTAASKILQGYEPPTTRPSSLACARPDAVLVGKTNMDEFAMGSSSENSAFGPTHNPWDLSRTPGGSSAGSAAAVSARMVSCSLGSDTGGSIRQPAALDRNGRPQATYGRVSRYGLIAFASSLDQVGPFATDVRERARPLGHRRTRSERRDVAHGSGRRLRSRLRQERSWASHRGPGRVLLRRSRPPVAESVRRAIDGLRDEVLRG